MHANDQLAKECLTKLVDLVHQHPHTANAEVVVSRIAQDEIWTYERAEGRRLIFPFQTASGAMREVQMDIVWNEPLLQAPVLTALPTHDASKHELRLWAATPELSLAWKLLWLASDFHARERIFTTPFCSRRSYCPNTSHSPTICCVASVPMMSG